MKFRDSYIGIVNTKNGFKYEKSSGQALTYDYKIPELNENVFDKIISYDTDGVMLWDGKRCESEPCSEEELKELKELLKPFKEGTANE